MDMMICMKAGILNQLNHDGFKIYQLTSLSMYFTTVRSIWQDKIESADIQIHFWEHVEYCTILLFYSNTALLFNEHWIVGGIVSMSTCCVNYQRFIYIFAIIKHKLYREKLEQLCVLRADLQIHVKRRCGNTVKIDCWFLAGFQIKHHADFTKTIIRHTRRREGLKLNSIC